MKVRINGKSLTESIGEYSNRQDEETTCSKVANEGHVVDPESKATACILPEDHVSRANLKYYRLYFSKNIKDVCKGDPSCMMAETTSKITTPKMSDCSIPYYWRVDTVLASGEILEGRVWST